MKRTSLFGSAVALTLLLSSCGGTSPTASKSDAPAAAPAKPAVPAEIQSAAEAALGSETEVLAYGDLAKNGHQEVLAVNRLKITPQTHAAGTLVSRVVVIENDNGRWKELFRCDEHLKNTEGFLGGTPLSPVTGWRLQSEQDADKGLELYFTPIEKPAGGYVQTLGVRWNPELKRYQSLDRTFEQFLGEVPSLETPQSQLAR
jgi:hypothetical protein